MTDRQDMREALEGMLKWFGKYPELIPDWPAQADKVKAAIAAGYAALAARDAMSQSEFAARVLGAIHDYAVMKPEEDEDWESWYTAAFELLSSNVGALFAARDAQAESGAPTLWEAFEMGFGLRSAMLGHVNDGRDVGRLTTCEFWHPAMRDMHVGTNLNAGLTVGEAIVRLKSEVRRRLDALAAAPSREQVGETEQVINDLVTYGISVQRISPSDFFASPSRECGGGRQLSEEQREALEYALYALRQMTSTQSDDAREVIRALLANGE